MGEPLVAVNPELDSSSSVRLPSTLHHLADVVSFHADNYEPEASPDIYSQGDTLKLRDIRDDYIHRLRRQPSDSCIYACIKALLIVYHARKFEHTFAIGECKQKKKAGVEMYNMFHTDATASVHQFARKQKRPLGHVYTLLTAGLYADLDLNHTKELAASPGNQHHIRRAENLLHRLGECLHNDKDIRKDISEHTGKHVSDYNARCAEDQYW